MNDFNKQIGLQQSIPLKDSFKSDNLAVCLIIFIGVSGLFFLPSTPLSDINPYESAHQAYPGTPLTSNKVYASGFSFIAKDEKETIEQHTKQIKNLPLLNVDHLKSKTIAISLTNIVSEWSYSLKVDDGQLHPIEAGKMNWTFDRSGSHTLEIIARNGSNAQLLNVQEIWID